MFDHPVARHFRPRRRRVRPGQFRPVAVAFGAGRVTFVLGQALGEERLRSQGCGRVEETVGLKG